MGGWGRGGGSRGRRGVGGVGAEQKHFERKFERSERSKHIKGSIYFKRTLFIRTKTQSANFRYENSIKIEFLS